MASRFGRKKRAKMRAELLGLLCENEILADRAMSHAKAYSDLAERVHAGIDLGIRCEPEGPDWVYTVRREAVQQAIAAGTADWLAAQIAEKFRERMVKEMQR